jgi:7-cyano-7-deazaguanine reductase
LFPIPRQLNRTKLGLPEPLPFKGIDIWNAYELSWLNQKGKPVVAIGEFIFPCESANIIEAKSLKLYLNSFNNTPFINLEKVISTIQQNLSTAVNADVKVKITTVDHFSPVRTWDFTGDCLDGLDIQCDTYLVTPDFLITEKESVSEAVYSDLLKSNCLITGQPDWGSVQISYVGKKIKRDGLLKYIISYRNHNEFGEQCVERIFWDITQQCAPEKLSVYARFTRRGGKDINVYRSTEDADHCENFRLSRQ